MKSHTDSEIKVLKCKSHKMFCISIKFPKVCKLCCNSGEDCRTEVRPQITFFFLLQCRRYMTHVYGQQFHKLLSIQCVYPIEPLNLELNLLPRFIPLTGKSQQIAFPIIQLPKEYHHMGQTWFKKFIYNGIEVRSRPSTNIWQSALVIQAFHLCTIPINDWNNLDLSRTNWYRVTYSQDAILDLSKDLLYSRVLYRAIFNI